MSSGKNPKEVFEKMTALGLSKAEKEQMRAGLISFMEKNPVRNLDSERPGLRERIYSLTQKFMHALIAKPVSLVIALVVVAGGGTSVAAQSSIPGDVLYKYKLVVNENVVSWFTFSDEAQARLDFELANRRLEEAEELAVRGSLDAQTSADLESRFADHVADGYDDLARLRGDEKFEESAEVSSDFESELRAHQNLLINIVGSDAEVSAEGILERVRLEIDAAANLKQSSNVEVQKGPDVKQAAEGKLKAAENKLESTVKFVEKKAVNIKSQTRANVDAKVDAAVELVEEGKLMIEAQNYADAFVRLQEAHETAQEVKAFLQGELRVEDKDIQDEAQAQSNLDVDTKVKLDLKGSSKTEGELKLGL